MKTLVIKWQRLLDENNQTCPRCGSTEDEIERAVNLLRQSLSPLGIEVMLQKAAIDKEDFNKDPLQSNNILIENRAIEEWLGARVGQSQCCNVCGDTECRTIEIEGQVFETIPATLIIKAGLIAASRVLPVETKKQFLTLKQK